SVTRLVILDHIPSNYGVVLPVKEIVKVCHRSGVQVLVDGAHALGMLDINMRDISADYYIGNAHKWFCNPKGCGFLYVDSAHHSLIRPLVVSHGFGSGFTAEFLWSGLMDYTSYLSLLTVIQFWRHYNPQKIRHYIRSLSREAGEYLVSQWGTGLLSNIDHFCGLMLVQLPAGVLKKDDAISYDDAELIQNELHHKYKIEVKKDTQSFFISI
uniref:Aminotransferase class V domain-containing protein n=1 Tax=Amphimedon queenslandica TaxID=400682 RepID=A0A1X7SYM8_AMPQE